MPARNIAGPVPGRVSRSRPGRGIDPWILAILGLGLLIRLPAVTTPGYPPDISFWKSWLSYATTFGIQNVYALDLPGQPYPPLLLYLLWGLGRLYTGLWPDAGDTPILTAFVKIPAVAGDLLVALFLARYAGRRAGARGISARAAAALLAFHPALVWLSSYWGQVDILHGGLVAGGWGAALSGHPVAAGLLLGLGIMTKPQALIAAPAAAVLIAARSGRRGLGRASCAGAAVLVALCLPFVLAGYGQKLVRIYVGAGNVYPYLSVNAFNPWWCSLVARGGSEHALEFRDDTSLIGPLTPRIVGILLVLSATGWIAWRCRRAAAAPGRGGESRLWRLLTLQWLAFFLLPTQIHERYLVPALLSMAPALILEVRWKWIYLALSAGILMNLLFLVPGAASVFAAVRIASADGILVALGFVAVAAVLIIAEMREDGAAMVGAP